MNMHEVSLFIMQVDPISWEHSFGDIASADFFHVFFLRKIPRLAVDINRHVRMVVDLIRTWCEYVGQESSKDE